MMHKYTYIQYCSKVTLHSLEPQHTELQARRVAIKG